MSTYLDGRRHFDREDPDIRESHFQASSLCHLASQEGSKPLNSEAKADFQIENGLIKQIYVTCTCGCRIELSCDY